MLKGHVKEKISTFYTEIAIVPACKAQHPRADVQNTNQQEETQPFIATTFVVNAFTQ